MAQNVERRTITNNKNNANIKTLPIKATPSSRPHFNQDNPSDLDPPPVLDQLYYSAE
eukprot:CAMPEP_0201644418 /NCGR_PEP_ID=MMETSP0493-20130528/30164_1 /ASSEMBLY_ACC=CAM_ASM_000838 /TAXON_ID=420259 /ORGANISM="Thalassiosira gravida, Strain GMp14c1" /LENGTH=56 /DNA_ID=CAMNT_0048119103 /DNA_START=114 /DNA_END=284 /DNA_ORIENTATION=-